MYAIVREGNGKYYLSTVFGYYNNPNDKWDYSHMYRVVLNREKTALVNQHCWGDGNHGIVATVLAVDSDQHDCVISVSLGTVLVDTKTITCYTGVTHMYGR